jgi:ABC-type transport system involved in cytochrome c biogenesis permease subunit
MPQPIWMTITLSFAALLTLIGAVVAWGRRAGASLPRLVERISVLAAWLIVLGIFLYRAAEASGPWRPLASHLDGLLLLTLLAGATGTWLQWTGRLRGVDRFVLPVLSILLVWAVCASRWTFRPFPVQTAWDVMHTASVYTGLGATTVAAAAAAMFLYVDHQLHRRARPAEALRHLGTMASLESIEQTMHVSAWVGFALVSIAMISGLVLSVHDPGWLGTQWWYSPKVLLAAVGWAVYAIVVHVRLAPLFRGRRAAVLTIAGFVVLMLVLGIAISLSGCSESWQGRVRIGSDPSVSEDTLDPTPPRSPEVSR